MAIRTQIIPVTRKPRKCPVCGNEVIDIIYGTGAALEARDYDAIRHYRVEITTEFDEHEILRVTVVSEEDE